MISTEEIEVQITKMQALKVQLPPDASADVIAQLDEQIASLTAQVETVRGTNGQRAEGSGHGRGTGKDVTPLAMGLQTGLKISDLLKNPDLDGDGVVDEKDAELSRMLKAMDVDGDGTVCIAELIAAARKVNVDKKESIKRVTKLKKILMLVVLGALASMGLLLGLMVAANEASKDTKPTSSGVLETIDGKPVTTTETQTSLGLAALALLPLTSLDQLRQIKLKMQDGFASYAVSGYKKYNNGNLDVFTVQGVKVMVADGYVSAEDQYNKDLPLLMSKRRLLASNIIIEDVLGFDEGLIMQGEVEITAIVIGGVEDLSNLGPQMPMFNDNLGPVHNAVTAYEDSIGGVEEMDPATSAQPSDPDHSDLTITVDGVEKFGCAGASAQPFDPDHSDLAINFDGGDTFHYTRKTEAPTAAPTAPTAAPTGVPTAAPTGVPTAAPTAVPTAAPTAAPTAPTAPTPAPTAAPTAVPTAAPTAVPTAAPTMSTEDGYTELMDAASNGLIDKVNEILQTDVNVDARIVVANPTAENKCKYPQVLGRLQGRDQRVYSEISVDTSVYPHHWYNQRCGYTALLYAAEFGHVDVVQALFGKNANVSAADFKQTNGLMLAAKNGHLEVVNALLDMGVDVDAQDTRKADIFPPETDTSTYSDNREMIPVILDSIITGYSALMYAAEKGHMDVVKALIEKGAKLDAANYEKTNALMLAAKNGHLEVVKALLDMGVDVDAQDEYEWYNDVDGRIDGIYPYFTALMYAANKGHADVVEALLAAGANANAENQDGAVLYRARTAIVVELLLGAGAEVRKYNGGGNNALLANIRRGNTDIVKLLLEADSSSEHIDWLPRACETAQSMNNIDRTALMLAAEQGHLDIVQLLLDAGADVTLRHGCKDPGYERTAFMFAVIEGYKDIVKVLADKVDLDLIFSFGTYGGYTALMFVSDSDEDGKHHIWDIANTILENGADVNLQSWDGSTALMYAVQHRNMDMFNALLEKGSSIDLQNRAGHTALMYAVKEHDLSLVNALLDEGADVNLQNEDGNSALMFAAIGVYSSVAEVLIANGANVDLKNEDGHTARNIVLTNGHSAETAAKFA